VYPVYRNYKQPPHKKGRHRVDNSRERLEQQIRFILEIDKEKNIFRQTHLTGYGRNENDSEHAWHMAIMVYLLREYSNADIDVAHTMMMCLIHDIVEIDAGDTYAYDEEGKKTQKEREEKAAERIFGLLPEDQRDELRALFEEFEADETNEAHFAHAMDNFQPLLLNDYNGGKDWDRHGVSRQQVDGRQEKTGKGSRILLDKTREILDKNEALGHIKS
jgi:putative hydrolase of HD superfamily